MRDIQNIQKKLLPWSEKYRPANISDVIYHHKITSTIVSYMKSNNLPHLLFYGPPGTGKTSTIVAIAKHYYKEDFDNMILILNASEERGIETVRNRIKQFVICKGLPERSETPAFKLIILDEIDAMTDDAQAILRKVIEKYVSNVRFCFICNYINQIIEPINSRCVKIRFKPIGIDSIITKLKIISRKENINIDENSLRCIAEISNGDLRKSILILQNIKYLNPDNYEDKKVITEDDIYKMCKYISRDDLNEYIISIKEDNKISNIIRISKDIINKGYIFNSLIIRLIDFISKNDDIIEESKAKILFDISFIEKNINDGADEYIQILKLLNNLSNIL